MEVARLVVFVFLCLTTVVVCCQPSVSLRDLGLSEVQRSQLNELVSRLLPPLSPEEPTTVSSIWKTSHVSADSFFQNKYGEKINLVCCSFVLFYKKKTLTHFVFTQRVFTKKTIRSGLAVIPPSVPQPSSGRLL